MSIIDAITIDKAFAGNRACALARRFETPSPGDVVRWPTCPDGRVVDAHRWHLNRPTLTWDASTNGGRIDGHLVPGRLHVVINGRSARVHLTDTGHVSIGGGPFALLDPAHLLPLHVTEMVKFWMFTGDFPPARSDVDVMLPRPVFRYDPRERCTACREPIVLDDPADPESWVHAVDALDGGTHTAEHPPLEAP